METQTSLDVLTVAVGQDDRLASEIAYRLSLGQAQLSLECWAERIKALGYRFQRAMDCRSSAQYMTGERAGLTYPCLSLYVVEQDTGICWANVSARRDARWEQLKAGREDCFAVVKGHLAEW